MPRSPVAAPSAFHPGPPETQVIFGDTPPEIQHGTVPKKSSGKGDSELGNHHCFRFYVEFGGVKFGVFEELPS